MRITQRHLVHLVEAINSHLNLEPTGWKDGKSVVGAYGLDGAYGGWRVIQYSNESGGERNVGHEYRMTARETWYMLRGIEDYIYRSKISL